LYAKHNPHGTDAVEVKTEDETSLTTTTNTPSEAIVVTFAPPAAAVPRATMNLTKV
jgi:hypothetical protein